MWPSGTTMSRQQRKQLPFVQAAPVQTSSAPPECPEEHLPVQEQVRYPFSCRSSFICNWNCCGISSN